MATHPRHVSHVFEGVDRVQFRQHFGVRAFLLRHCLATSPLFSIARLANAAELLLTSGYGDNFKVNHGTYKTGAQFAEMGAKQKLLTVFDQLPESDSWIRLSDIGKVDPDYREVVRAALQDLEDAYGQPIVSNVTLAGISVFIASPHIVTPYHIDHEANFLCQIAGHKEIYLYDPADRELLPITEIEQFYAGDGTAARYREDMLSRGKRFELAPGLAVHHPSLAPHRVRNGTEVSISVGINFCTRELDSRARVYQVNHLLRKAGFNPAPPGKSSLVDAFKARGMQLVCNPHPTSTPDLLFSGLKRLRSVATRLKTLASSARRLVSRSHAGLGG